MGEGSPPPTRTVGTSSLVVHIQFSPSLASDKAVVRRTNLRFTMTATRIAVMMASTQNTDPATRYANILEPAHANIPLLWIQGKYGYEGT